LPARRPFVLFRRRPGQQRPSNQPTTTSRKRVVYRRQVMSFGRTNSAGRGTQSPREACASRAGPRYQPSPQAEQSRRVIGPRSRLENQKNRVDAAAAGPASFGRRGAAAVAHFCRGTSRCKAQVRQMPRPGPPRLNCRPTLHRSNDSPLNRAAVCGCFGERPGAQTKSRPPPGATPPSSRHAQRPTLPAS